MAHTTCNYFDTLQKGTVFINCRFIVGMACFALYFDEKCFKTASKNYGRRKRWQREHQKRNRFILAKKTLHMHNAFFCSFLSRRCTTTTWKCLISRFVEDGNIRQHFFSFPELWYSPSEFNSKKICQHLTNYTRWNKRDKVSGSANSLFKWRFLNRRRRFCLSSQIRVLLRAVVSGKWVNYFFLMQPLAQADICWEGDPSFWDRLSPFKCCLRIQGNWPDWPAPSTREKF